MFKFMCRRRGAISIFLILVLVPMLIVSSIFVDMSRIRLAKAAATSAGDLTLNTALTNYDAVLKDMYGLFATSQSIDEMLENPDLIISLAQRLKNERLKVNALNKAIVANEEYINLGKIIENTDGAITIGQYAKLISSKVDMGRNRLYKWFRDNGYFINKCDDKNTPKQIYIESGLFKLHEKVVQTENGEILSVKPLITGKGQKYFTAKILESVYVS